MLVGSNSAQAAIIGEFSFTGSINAQLVANPAAPPALATQFNFLELPVTPPLGTGDVRVSLFDVEGVFAPFAGVDGKIKDIIVADPGVVVAPGQPLPNFLTIPVPPVVGVPDTSFTLTQIDNAPTLEQVGNDVIVSFGVLGTFLSTDAAINGALGEIIFSSQFVDTTIAQVVADFSDGNGLTTDYSAQAIARRNVPEPSAALGLGIFALGLGALSSKKAKNIQLICRR